MDAIQNDIRDAIEKETASAIERFPMFASLHEAYAVILEERDESADDLETLNRYLRFAWERIKMNDGKNALSFLARARGIAEHLAIEACQVSAMCEKAALSAALWSEKEGSKKDAEV